MDSNYSYASQPQAAPMGGKKKYRDEGENSAPDALNLMQDPRVKRGNTYAADVMTSSTKRDQERMMKNSKGSSRRKQVNPARRSGTPPPVDGRVHMDIQTDQFLEELTDRPLELDAETQTLAYMDRPKSPLFVPAKIGRDMETMIMPGDLFDFDLEVEPILEVLVGKTIHVAMLELMQEEELAAIRQQQEEFEAIRNVELTEVQRLEAESRRKADERSRRVAQERQRLADRQALEEKVAARAFANQYLSDLHTGVFDDLQDEGFFFDPVKKDIEDVFMVDLLAGIGRRVTAYDAAQNISNELIQAAANKAKTFGTEAKRLRKELADKLAAEAETKRLEELEAARLAAEAAAAAEAAGEAGEE